MIIKGSQRGGGMQLGAHLLKAENEQVEVHEVRGFIADDVKGAMKEAQAVAMGTRCKQHLFSVSLSPPEKEKVGVAAFGSAIDRIEKATGLTGQPRMIVFHEKEGRRHAHCVWSRIDAETMTARPLPFFKMKLREVSKGLYLEHGWQMPRGLRDSKERDPRNFSLGEWQQAKRLGSDPDLVKAITRECWAASNSQESFASALLGRGLGLATGTRDYLVVAHDGRVHAIPRLLGVRTKQVRERLGAADKLKSVEVVKAELAASVAPRLKELILDADRSRSAAMIPLRERSRTMKFVATCRRALRRGRRPTRVATCGDVRPPAATCGDLRRRGATRRDLRRRGATCRDARRTAASKAAPRRAALCERRAKSTILSRMPRNIEIKARAPRPSALLDAVLDIADRGPTVFAQDDTFFGCPNGRLKLRTFSEHEGQLIFYRRDDQPGPRLSEYVMATTAEPDALRGTLALACGVVGRVKKTRTLCFVGPTRVHLDDVDGLGHYVELEVVLEEHQTPADGEAIAQDLMRRLGIEAKHLERRAYVDLIGDRATANAVDS